MTGIGSVGRTFAGLARALRWPLLTAALVGLIGFLAVYANSMKQENVYQSRIAMTVRPVDKTPASAGGADYNVVVTANMPAVVELAGTRSVIEGARRRVPGAPPVGEISGNTVVDIVPASSVVRVSVTAGTPEMATKLVTALTDEMIKQDIFAPVGKMVRLDKAAPVAMQVKPVAKVSRGLALLLGLALGVATFVLLSMLLPVVFSRGQLKRIVKDPTLPVLDLNRRDGVERAAALVNTFGGARTVPIAKGQNKAERALEEQVPSLDAHDRLDTPVLLVVRRGTVRPAEVESALGLAQRAGARLVGVALS